MRWEYNLVESKARNWAALKGHQSAAHWVLRSVARSAEQTAPLLAVTKDAWSEVRSAALTAAMKACLKDG